jgi:hypothetical protein
LTITLLSLTALILGLFTGSLLTEAVILVPYWRSLKPETFLDLHGTMGPQLYKYFAPLTISATVIPVITAAYCIWESGDILSYSTLSSLLILIIFGIYFYYFKSANDSFASGAVGVSGLSAELRRWFVWHWIRTVMAIAAFLFAIIAISQN